MMNFSYTVSPSLKKELENIENTRNKILIQIISPRDELQLRWEAMLNRTVSSIRLLGIETSKNEVLKVFLHPDKSNLSSKELSIANYKKIYDFISQNWFVSSKKISSDAIGRLFENSKNQQIQLKELNNILEFIQVNPEHPIIQAALSFILISELLPDNETNILLSLIVAILFLYKYGYDFRGMLNLEEYVSKDVEHIKSLIKTSRSEKNISSFLEYFTQAVAIQSEHALEKFAHIKIERHLPEAFFSLTGRQKEILSLFDQPGARITNKKIQNLFNISQITASRDLARLNTLGLIFSAGKGRSVYYTKI